ncbi:MAG: spermidine synthase, partial [Verrucomicrobiota bacterium]
FMLASLEKTLRAVFASVELHQAASGNAFFVASATPLRLRRPYEYTAVHPSVLDPFRTAMNETRETDPTHGIVLTDDFNPVDFHDAQNRERQRRELAQSMQEL